MSYPEQQQPPPYGQPPQDQPQYPQQSQGIPPYVQQQPGYGQPYGQPGYGYGAPVQPRWNGLAIAGFILSFLISIVGLILSIIALNQINKSGGMQKGKGLAIAGIIISAISILFGLLYLLGSRGSTTTTFF